MPPDASELEQGTRRIFEHAWAAVAARPDKLSGNRVAVPEIFPIPEPIPESRSGTDFPVLKHLQPAISLAKAHELAALASDLEAHTGHLTWTQNPSYTEETCDRSLLDGYAYAPLSGPEGPLLCTAPRSGFFLMGPNVTYPGHNHAPREVYMILTPGGEWQLDGRDWFDVAPGDLIFHAPWRMHAMRTTDTPMIAFASWIDAGEREAIGWADRGLSSV